MHPNSISRRTALRQMTRATAACAAGAALGRSARGETSASGVRPRVTVRLDDTFGIIKPALYGQFAEHIGGVIYDGVWVGRGSKIANSNGIRQSLIEHVKRLGPIVIRWPGGCFADKYHWRDGIGDPASRPRRYGRWQNDTESNAFGTHEFMEFCRLCGAEPYFAGNVGTGGVEEFQRWMEYCNAPAGKTTLADERVANGAREPFGVRYWGVGNESWGCGGKFTPEDYCGEYRKFTEWLPAYGTAPYLVAAGPNSNDLDWTRRFFRKWADGARAPLNAWAAHYYCGTTGHALQFSLDQWYEMLQKANFMETLIRDQWTAMGEIDPQRQVKLIIDEWGCWHPAGTEINAHHLFEQMGCLRDALVAGLTLDVFNRHAEKIEMANIAQLINNLHSLFLADGDRFVATPTFHVFEMYRPHQGATAVRADFEADDVPFQSGGGPQSIFRLAGSASRRDRSLTLTLVHSHAMDPAEATIRLPGAKAVRVRQTVLTHAELNAHNTFDEPELVTPRVVATDLAGSEFVCTLPPASVMRLDIELG